MKWSVFVVFVLLTGLVKAQTLLHNDGTYGIYYSLVGDTVELTVEFLNDGTLSANDNGVLEASDDFVQLMLDDNASGTIDAVQTDLMYTYDESGVRNICAEYITDANTATGCGTAITGGRALAQTGTSGLSAANHSIFKFYLPKQELLKGTNICSRFSFKVHQGGTPLANSVNIPTSADNYFVDPYYAVTLFADVDLGPDGGFCAGDTIWANSTYPFYFWNTLSVENYTVVNIDHEYGLTINDGTCVLSDSVDVHVLDESYCAGGKYRFPNVVSPNSDGRNDVFQLILQASLLNEVTSWEGSSFRVYNRYGILVKRIDNGVPMWDFRSENGDMLSVGTYFYTYLPPAEVEGRKVINGFVLLVHEE